MRVLVQKFGGTSVAEESGRAQVVARLLQARSEGFSPVAVVSAMGRAPSPYATDSLLQLLDGGRGSADPREQDLLLGCGEVIAAVVLSHQLRRQGCRARAFTGAQAGLLTDPGHGEARIREVRPEGLLAALARGEVPVVAGFQGVDPDGELTTLGRGGSDTTAVALGAALRAEAVEIYTDVEGVLTADPRRVAEARVLARVSFEEMGEMAHEGARVLHPRAVEMARRHGLALRVRSTFSGAPGTEIVDLPEASGRLATGIVTVAGLTRVRVDLPEEGLAEARTRALEGLAGAGLSLDLINLVGPTLYFIAPSEPYRRLGHPLLGALGFPVEEREGCAKISVVGQGMRGVPGVMLRIQRALAGAGVELIHSTDSHITLSCLVPGQSLDRAAQALHAELGLGG